MHLFCRTKEEKCHNAAHGFTRPPQRPPEKQAEMFAAERTKYEMMERQAKQKDRRADKWRDSKKGRQREIGK